MSLFRFQLHMARMLPGFTSFVLITTKGLSFIDTKQYVTDGKRFIPPDSRGGRTSGERSTIQNMYILRSS